MGSTPKRGRQARPAAEPPRVSNIRPAGPDHQVVSVHGGTGAYMRQPCPTCPWRIDAIGEFPAEAFRHSAHTAYDMDGEMFGCHTAGNEKPATCAGFLLRGSGHNMAWRLKVSAGVINMAEVSSAVPLFESYREMAVANGVDPGDPALRPCRDDGQYDAE